MVDGGNQDLPRYRRGGNGAVDCRIVGSGKDHEHAIQVFRREGALAVVDFSLIAQGAKRGGELGGNNRDCGTGREQGEAFLQGDPPSADNDDVSALQTQVDGK
ncbi:hypothetical protein GURASL_02570 [Geotalea uraniireducens]|uniref:Uncharacterized protein n=1 Tax=Geotalea uraniireducens TaxID=351604 RepID=A0ABM8EFZ6_9BACT|nr:hypothetical protein GURASL_02570 [Geotalea uraniireducens]